MNGLGAGEREGLNRSEQLNQDGANPNLHDPAPPPTVQPPVTATTRRPEGESEVHPPYAQGGLQSQQEGLQNWEQSPLAPVVQEHPRSPTLVPQAQEFFTAESRTAVSPEQHPMRWTTRVTEFFRTTAHRGVLGVDRLLDNLGFQNGHVQPGTMLTGRAMERTVQISPPEQLPERRASPIAPPVPVSWAGSVVEPPLFERAQLERMRQARRDHPLIYGQASEVGSDNSSRLQAEVQRQLEEHAARYQDQVRSLQDEVQRLREHRELAREQGILVVGQPPAPPEATTPSPPIAPPPTSPVPGGQAGNLPGVQPGNLPQHPSVPGGQASNLPGVQAGNLPQHPSVPGGQAGNLPGVQPGNLPQHPSVPGGQASNLPGVQAGNLPQHPSVPGGQASNLPGVQAGNLPQHPSVPGGQASNLPGVQAGNLPQHPSVPGGQASNLPGVQAGNLPQHPSVPGGQASNLPGVQAGNLPQHPSVPGGQASNLPGVQAGNLPQHPSVVSGQARHIPQVSGPHEEHGSASVGDKSVPSSAQQWLSGQQQDHIALLAGGMAQLQQVMLRQMSSQEKEKGEDASPEAVKPGTSSLPALPQVHATTSSIDIADWLEMLAAPMSDLSDGSSTWWQRIRQKAGEAYEKWTNAGPMEKLSIAPERDGTLEGGRWSRVNSRAASMIMLALHESVRSEMVARRLTGSTVSLLFRLMTLYQPGGEAERTRILHNLQCPNEESEPAKVVEALRSWERWLRRCKELSLATPDPTILSKGLNSMVRKVVEKNPDMGFRTNLVRSTLQVDTRPSYETIDTYYKHLMAECEALAVSSSSLTTSGQAASTTTVAKPEPKIRPMKTEPKASTPTIPTTPSRTTATPDSAPGEQEAAEGFPSEKKDVPCKYFGRTYKGCARANKCPFRHSWDGLEKEKSSRCLACGGKHMAKDCINKKSGSPKAATPKTAPQAKAAAQQTSSTTTTSTTSNKTVRIEEPTSTSGSSAGSQELGAADLKEILADVGKMLKAMSATTLKRARVTKDTLLQRVSDLAEVFIGRSCGDGSEEGRPGGLLDSGASNAMRPADPEKDVKPSLISTRNSCSGDARR